MSAEAKPARDAEFDPPVVPPSDRSVPTAGTQGCAYIIVALALFSPILLYFGFFAAIVIDEVAQTHYLAPSRFPKPVAEGLEFIYAPLIEGVETFVD